MSAVFVFVGVSALLGATYAAPPFLATDNLGLLRGIQEFSEDNKIYFAFKGIRYAEPPVGPLRFKEPREAALVFADTFVNATTLGSHCLQLLCDRAAVIGDEDCLFINVYTPSYVCPDTKYPVVVFFHGGAFMCGDGDVIPSRLVTRDIVLVTLNYRVGVLGFLSSGDRDLPGNLGLLDQQLALKWVQKNIGHFCGDRNNVTIAGASAGSASTNFHMLSPGSRGLFQKAIANSGSVLNPWVQHFGDRERVRSFARSVGCQSSVNQPISDMLPCLRSVNGFKLVQAQTQFLGWHHMPFAPLGPVVDHQFLPDDPFKLLMKDKVAQVPVLMSCTTQEGIYPIGEIAENATALKELDEHWNELAPLLFDYEATARTKEERDKTSSIIRSRYFGSAAISNITVPQLIQLGSDRHFLAGIDSFARTLASRPGSKAVYMYQYAYSADYSDAQTWYNLKVKHGVSHVDDVLLVFPRQLRNLTQADRNMSRSLVDIYESFIKKGVPITEHFSVWKPVPTTGNQLTLLNITSYNNGTLVTVPELGSASFWRSLPLQESGFANSNVGGTAATMVSSSFAIVLIVASVTLHLVVLQ